MALDIYKVLKQKGFIMLPYSILRTLGPPKSIVTMELLAEFNYAQNNSLNYYEDFLCDLNRVSDILGMKRDFYKAILDELENLGFFTRYPSDIETTSNIYTQILDEVPVEANRRMDEKLFA